MNRDTSGPGGFYGWVLHTFKEQRILTLYRLLYHRTRKEGDPPSTLHVYSNYFNKTRRKQYNKITFYAKLPCEH